MQVSNLLYVDQPVGTGFSYTTDKSDIRHDEKGVSDDLYDFLQVWHWILSFVNSEPCFQALTWIKISFWILITFPHVTSGFLCGAP